MSIVLFRVDERLIHGQVVVGWGTNLRPDQIIVVDNALAASSWEQELYTFGLPDELEVSFATVEAAREQLAQWRDSKHRAMILTRDVSTMKQLSAGGLLRGEEINIGGIHHAPGRRAVLPYLYLSDDEARAMTALAADGAAVSARDLPGTRRVELNDLLRGSGLT